MADDLRKAWEVCLTRHMLDDRRARDAVEWSLALLKERGFKIVSSVQWNQRRWRPSYTWDDLEFYPGTPEAESMTNTPEMVERVARNICQRAGHGGFAHGHWICPDFPHPCTVKPCLAEPLARTAIEAMQETETIKRRALCPHCGYAVTVDEWVDWCTNPACSADEWTEWPEIKIPPPSAGRETE